MSKAKMLAAREAIQAQQYDKARSILKTVDHPKAREWLARLDEIAPQQTNQKKASRLWIALAAVALVALIGSAAFVLLRGSGNKPVSDIEERVVNYCLGLKAEYGGSTEVCADWASNTVGTQSRLAVVQTCEQSARDSEEAFRDCLVEQDILPPGVTLQQ